MPATKQEKFLRQLDTHDKRQLYVAWHGLLQLPAADWLPAAGKTWKSIGKALGRECLLFALSGYAPFNAAAGRIAAAALDDRATGVRQRAQQICNYVRKHKLPDSASGFWFFFSNQKGRQPRGDFAHTIVERHADWLNSQGYKATYAFAHEARFTSGKKELRLVWDSFDTELFAYLYADGGPQGNAVRITDESSPAFREQIAAVLSGRWQ